MEGRKITKGKREDYQRKVGSQLREGRKITKGRMEVIQGKEGSQPREGRKMTMGGMKDYQLNKGSILLLKPDKRTLSRPYRETPSHDPPPLVSHSLNLLNILNLKLGRMNIASIDHFWSC